MEKKTAHYRLEHAIALLHAGKVKATFSALTGAAALGCNFEGMVEIIGALTNKDFYKSMTTYEDHTAWQDVYRPATKFGDIYLKLTAVDELLVVSFKEL